MARVFGRIGLLSFGGPRRADRPDAPRAGRAPPLAERGAIPRRPRLLHVAARPRGDAARHLLRLAPARRRGRAAGGAAIRAAGRGGDLRAGLHLRGLWRPARGAGGVPRHQGRRRGGRGPGPAEGRPPRPDRARPLGDRGPVLRGDLRAAPALPPDRRGGGALRRARRAGGRARPVPPPPVPCAPPRARWRSGGRSGSCRWPPCRSTAASWPSSAGSSPGSPSSPSAAPTPCSPG